ncbi:MAG: DUF255 domain-containing protein [Frankiales bacterium]|nr:MAG: DUF255 domain-containing protein [Frankiales bacterium]
MPNRLASSTSPYLLQHKDNPVDWWEWSPEAFAEAERRGVPVLLSIGYAACHWCHVISYVLLSASRRRVHAQKMTFQRDHRSNVMLCPAGSPV